MTDLEKYRLTDEKIRKITDHWNPVPSRLDGIAPEAIKLRLFHMVADAQFNELVDAISPLLEETRREERKRIGKQMHLTGKSIRGWVDFEMRIQDWQALSNEGK